MSYRQTFFASITVLMTAALVACGGGSSSTGGGGGGGTNPITVTLSGAPATLAANTTAPITATVANDSANGGVSWSCAPSGACGTFSAPNTASGTAVTYTAPAAPTSVTITATSVTDRTKTGTATVTITAPPIALADGNYVFSLGGMDVAGGPQAYFVTGVFTVAGGLITGGEQDFVDNTTATLHDSLSPASTFTTTADGNLQLVLTTCLALDCTQVDPVVGLGAPDRNHQRHIGFHGYKQHGSSLLNSTLRLLPAEPWNCRTPPQPPRLRPDLTPSLFKESPEASSLSQASSTFPVQRCRQPAPFSI